MSLFDTRLNEFEPDQLDLFLAMTEDKLSLLQNAINRAEEAPESGVRTALLDLYARQQASLILLQVQLENAKSDLKQIETTHQ